ncbi:hypothetical protein LguiA_013313 [Lonicera macranthoides]
MQRKLLIPTLTPKQLNQIQAHIVKSPKPHTLNILLGSLTYSPTPQNAFPLYNLMLQNPYSHNQFTFTHALKACSSTHALQKALEIHAYVVKTGHSSDIFIQNSLIHLYIVENCIGSACRVFDSIRYPDVVSWTSIISGLCKCGFEEEAIVKFSSMDVKPNSVTLVSVLSACCNVKALNLGKAVHSYGLKNVSYERNLIFDNALLDFYVKRGSLAYARHLFVKMPERDVVTWTTLVGGFVQRGLSEDAVRVFEEMVQRGEVEPNEATIVSVLSACSLLCDLSLGHWVHSYVDKRHDLAVDGNLGNAVVNMYVKCGNMSMAVQVFNKLKCKDIVSWGTMISGMAMNSKAHYSFPLFSLMLVHGILPDDVAFIGLLSACSHAGMVDQGFMFFKAMIDVYGILPQMQHYACVVDMYGRAGMLKEAEDFIREMPLEADGPIWGALLNACNIHGNEEMFERISPSLHCVKDVSIGTFALLSNSYASSNRWVDANKVRDEMRSMGLKKIAGSSWIEISK